MKNLVLMVGFIEISLHLTNLTLMKAFLGNTKSKDPNHKRDKELISNPILVPHNFLNIQIIWGHHGLL